MTNEMDAAIKKYRWLRKHPATRPNSLLLPQWGGLLIMSDFFMAAVEHGLKCTCKWNTTAWPCKVPGHKKEV